MSHTLWSKGKPMLPFERDADTRIQRRKTRMWIIWGGNAIFNTILGVVLWFALGVVPYAQIVVGIVAWTMFIQNWITFPGFIADIKHMELLQTWNDEQQGQKVKVSFDGREEVFRGSHDAVMTIMGRLQELERLQKRNEQIAICPECDRAKLIPEGDYLCEDCRNG